MSTTYRRALVDDGDRRRQVTVTEAGERLLARIDDRGGYHPGPSEGQTGAALERRGLVRWTFTDPDGRRTASGRLILTELGRQALTVLRENT